MKIETIEIPTHKRRRKIHGRNSIPAELITEVTSRYFRWREKLQ